MVKLATVPESSQQGTGWTLQGLRFLVERKPDSQYAYLYRSFVARAREGHQSLFARNDNTSFRSA